ncbi:MAG: LpxI family protein, partial [Leptospiraceae bacterium]|nr:LpxI family protein [Leptospiraceae bacterium]
ATLCKSSKPSQDERFDLPTVGLATLKIMKEYNFKTLALRSFQTIVVNPQEFLEFAEKSKINIISYEESLTYKDIRQKAKL